MHDDDPLLWDRRDPHGRVRGAWLLLRRNPFALPGAFPLLLCHWPNSFVAGTYPVPGRMTLEHRRRQEYIARRGTAAGYEVAVEKSLGRGTRSDVVVKGEAILAAEVQQTGIELREVLRRSRAAVKAGATPTGPPLGVERAGLTTGPPDRRSNANEGIRGSARPVRGLRPRCWIRSGGSWVI
jgi:hypothetical protein